MLLEVNVLMKVDSSELQILMFDIEPWQPLEMVAFGSVF